MQSAIDKFEALYAELRRTYPVKWDEEYYAKYNTLHTYLSEILYASGISFSTYFEHEILDLAGPAPNYNPNNLPFQASFIEDDYSDAWFKFVTLYYLFEWKTNKKDISPKGLIALGIKTLKETGPIPLAFIFELLYELNLDGYIPEVIKLIDAVLDDKEHEEFILQDILIWMEMVISEWYEPEFDNVIQKGLNHKYERTVEYFSNISKD